MHTTTRRRLAAVGIVAALTTPGRRHRRFHLRRRGHEHRALLRDHVGLTAQGHQPRPAVDRQRHRGAHRPARLLRPPRLRRRPGQRPARLQRPLRRRADRARQRAPGPHQRRGEDPDHHQRPVDSRHEHEDLLRVAHLPSAEEPRQLRGLHRLRARGAGPAADAGVRAHRRRRRPPSRHRRRPPLVDRQSSSSPRKAKEQLVPSGTSCSLDGV